MPRPPADGLEMNFDLLQNDLEINFDLLQNDLQLILDALQCQVKQALLSLTSKEDLRSCSSRNDLFLRRDMV